MSEVGRLIKEYREKKNFSQGKIAKAFGYSSPQYISNIERGVTRTSVEKALVLCRVLGIPKYKILKALENDRVVDFRLKIKELVF